MLKNIFQHRIYWKIFLEQMLYRCHIQDPCSAFSNRLQQVVDTTAEGGYFKYKNVDIMISIIQ